MDVSALLSRIGRYGLIAGLSVVVLAGAFAAVFILARWLSSWLGTDQASVDAGVVATFTGVALGFPAALLISWLAKSEARREAATERKDRRRGLLRTIQRDLIENLDQLVDRNRTVAVVPYLRTDVWQALAASGQLELVDDPDLLNVMARAYHRIATTADLERQIWEAFHDPAQWSNRVDRATGRNVTAVHRHSLEAAIRDQDPDTKAAIDVAHLHLAREFGEEPPPNRPLRADAQAD